MHPSLQPEWLHVWPFHDHFPWGLDKMRTRVMMRSMMRMILPILFFPDPELQG